MSLREEVAASRSITNTSVRVYRPDVSASSTQVKGESKPLRTVLKLEVDDSEDEGEARHAHTPGRAARRPPIPRRSMKKRAPASLESLAQSEAVNADTVARDGRAEGAQRVVVCAV